jgi:hypothetical protein
MIKLELIIQNKILDFALQNAYEQFQKELLQYLVQH